MGRIGCGRAVGRLGWVLAGGCGAGGLGGAKPARGWVVSPWNSCRPMRRRQPFSRRNFCRHLPLVRGAAGGFDEQFRGGGKAGSGRQGSSGTGGVGHDARNNTERRGEPKRPSPSAPLDIPPTGRNLTAVAANLSPDAGAVQTLIPAGDGVSPEGIGGVGLDLWDGGVLNGGSKV